MANFTGSVVYDGFPVDDYRKFVVTQVTKDSFNVYIQVWSNDDFTIEKPWRLLLSSVSARRVDREFTHRFNFNIKNYIE
jgi:hypothetical protein